MKRLSLIVVFAFVIITSASAQQKYFVDGFHGGVYGHYPILTYTQFLVDQMDKNPDWYIGLEIEPETWDTVKVKTPEAYLAFKNKLATDQVEYTNPSYGQSYLYCINGESIIRQFYYGIRKIRSHFPDVLIATYSVEEPCFTSCLPGILSKFGFRHAVIKCPNTCWGGYSAPYGGELVNFIGPDGTSLLSVPRYACEALEKYSVWQTTAWGNNPYYFKACFDYGIKNPVGMTYQDAGWTNGPWIGTTERKLHGMKYTRWTKYIEEQSVGKTTDDYHFSQEDVCPGLMWGSQIMQRLAQQCRHAEYFLPQAEKMAAMAQISNGFTLNQNDIDEAWRTLLLSQHHDCWIVPYNHLNKCGNWAENVKLWTAASDSLSLRVINAAMKSYNDNGKPAVKVYNTSGYERKEVVDVNLNDGRKMTVLVDVPAFGYTIIPNDQLSEPEAMLTIRHDANECTIGNDLYSITFDLQRGGVVKSLKKKDDGFEYIDPRTEFAFGELRGYFCYYRMFLSSAGNVATVKVLQDNELVKSILLDGEIAGTKFQKAITLRKGSPVIDCSLTIDWTYNQRIGDFTRSGKKAKDDKRTTFYDTRYALSLMLPTAMKSTKLYKSAPFDVCESKLKGTFFNDWDSIKHNVIQEWIDLKSITDNHAVALFTDHTTSYSYGENYPLALTAQYSGPGLWGRDYKITQPTHFRYAIIPHTGKWDEARINQLCTCWNEPLIVANSHADEKRSHSFISADGTGFELTSITRSGDDIVVRLYNATGTADKQQVFVNTDVKRAVEVDFLGNELQPIEATKNGTSTILAIAMARFGVHAYKLQIK